MSKLDNPNICGKQVEFKKEFKNTRDTFSGITAATEFLRKNGYSIGSMQREAPMGIKKGDIDISKWRNLSSKDILQLDGAIVFTDGGPRNGTATIYLNREL